MNAVEALDDYLLELLVEAAPAQADTVAAAPAPAVTAAEPVDAGDVIEANAASDALPAVAASSTGNEEAAAMSAATSATPAVLDIDATTAALLAEMDEDPAFAAAAPKPTVAASVVPDVDAITASLLAEMDADPAFAAAARKPAAAAPAAPDVDAITASLLAEMDADPAFAAAAAKPAAAASAAPDVDAITASLLAEMDADPAFVGAAPVPVPSAAAPVAAVPAKPRVAPPAPIAPIARRPQPRSRLPANIQAMFQPPPADLSPHRRAAERSTRWLRLRCGEQTYALELLKVQEVVLPVPLLPLRGAGRSILGIMNLRGQVVPVLDLGVHLSATPVSMDTQTRVVVLEENGETMGLRVSAVEDVTSLTDQQIEPPDTTRLCRISNQLFRGVARISSHPVILLDATELLH